MNDLDARLIVGLWLAVMLLIVGAACFFYLGTSSARAKKRVFRWYIGVGGVLILLWFWVVGGPATLLWGIPLYAICALISLKTTRFCEACGRTLMNQFTRVRYCPRCGAALDGQNDAAS